MFVLHEAFSIPLGDVAEILSQTPQACRQLAVRARRHLQESSPGSTPMGRKKRKACRIAAFQQACETGDLDALTRLLDADVVSAPTAAEW